MISLKRPQHNNWSNKRRIKGNTGHSTRTDKITDKVSLFLFPRGQRQQQQHQESHRCVLWRRRRSARDEMNQRMSRSRTSSVNGPGRSFCLPKKCMEDGWCRVDGRGRDQRRRPAEFIIMCRLALYGPLLTRSSPVRHRKSFHFSNDNNVVIVVPLLRHLVWSKYATGLNIFMEISFGIFIIRLTVRN